MSDHIPSIRVALEVAMPNLRAFALTLCGDRHLADDLVQETLLKAWSNKDKFTPGTNFKAWLFTILRNTYFSLLRKRRREVQDSDSILASNIPTPPEQFGHLEMREFQNALAQLSPDQREALLLVTAEGFSYEEVAQIAGCAAGTIKSRVNRARSRLVELMGLESPQDICVEASLWTGSARKLL